MSEEARSQERTLGWQGRSAYEEFTFASLAAEAAVQNRSWLVVWSSRALGSGSWARVRELGVR